MVHHGSLSENREACSQASVTQINQKRRGERERCGDDTYFRLEL